MNFSCQLIEATKLAGYDPKKLTDDRAIVRREFGKDFLPLPINGRTTCDLIECATLMLYADFRRDGYPVKVAAVIASHFRDAMRRFPGATELTAVNLTGGGSFIRPSDDKRLDRHARAGRFPTFELVINVRKLRERVLSAANVARLEAVDA